MPYRIDIPNALPEAVDRLVELGALDVEAVGDGLAAILPDGMTPERVAEVLNVPGVSVSAAVARDDGSVWLVTSRARQVGDLVIAAAEGAAPAGALRLLDSAAFGTGHHPTTVLCLEALAEMLPTERCDSVLDIGTGSGILALAALRMGAAEAVGVDTDAEALRVAAENARLNGLADRLRLVLGGPAAVEGTWPLVVANVLAAPLIDMASVLVQRVRGRGRLILSGIPAGVEAEVSRSYQHFGMRQVDTRARDGWTTLTLEAGW